MYLYLVRHGLSTGNAAHILQGWMDTDLMPEGVAQAEKTADFFLRYGRQFGLDWRAIYASPLKRANDTAQAIGRALAITPVIDPQLREMHGGQVEGKTLEEWQQSFPNLIPRWQDRTDLDFGWPDGETRAGFRDRVLGAISAIIHRHAPLDNVIVVTHGGVINTYLRYAVYDNPGGVTDFSAGNCSVTHIRYDKGETWVGCLVNFNLQTHLAEDFDVADAANPDLALQ